jgi:hypothetical protein
MLPTAEKLATIVICEDDALTREALCENFEADRPLPNRQLNTSGAGS